MKHKKLYFLTIFLVVVSFIISSCGQSAQDGELGRDPKTLVVAMYSNPGDLDPANSVEQIGNIIVHATYDGLVRADTTDINQVNPAVAESWTNNEDFTEWTFKLRSGLTFHDGTVLDAEAVKSSFTRLVTSDQGMSYILGGFISDPETQIIVVDPTTIQFKFDQPSPMFIKALASGYGSYLISPKAVAEHEQDGDFAHQWLTTNEAGSGPYVMTEYTPNQQVVLTRFEDWWGWKDGFNFEKVTLKIVPERSTRRSLIETGDVDITFNLSPEDWDVLKQNPDLVVDLPAGLSIAYITLGNSDYLQDPRVRQALNYAFDYDGFINGMWKGYSKRATSILPSGMLCYDPDVFVYNTDLEKAKQLLEEAGVPMDGSLTWLYWAEEGGGDMGAGLILQSQLQKLGINLKVEELDTARVSGIFYSDDLSEQRPDMFRWGWWPDYNDPTNEAWVTIATDAAGSNGGNGGFYSNARVDELMDQATVTLDEKELCEIYKEIQDITTRQDPPWIFLAERPDEMILRSDIGGYAAHKLYRQTFRFQDLYRIDN